MVKKRYLKGSFTVEAAFLTAMIIFIVYGMVITLFYFHDKNILAGALYETAETAARKSVMEEGVREEEIKKIFIERVSGKMILFRTAEVRSECQKNYVWISAQASAKMLRITAEVKSAVTEPEKTIRNIRNLKKLPASGKR